MEERIPSTENAPSSELEAPLRGLVESYIVNDWDTSSHPVFEEIRQAAIMSSTRPGLQPVISAPILFAPAPESKSEGSGSESEEELSLEEIYRDAEAESRRLVSAMTEYQEQVGSNKHTNYLQLQAAVPYVSWDDVLKEVELATSRYNDPTGTWGKLRQAFRKAGAQSGPASAWLGLLPSQSNYFSVLCGGLNLIFNAALRLNELREDIGKALADIPHLLSCANRNLNVFKRSQQLHKSSSDLFVATVAVIQHILRYYDLKSRKKLVGAFFKQSEYERTLQDKMEMLRARSEYFFQVAQSCSYEAVEATRRSVLELKSRQAEGQRDDRKHLNLARSENYLYNQTLSLQIDRVENKVDTIVNVVLQRISNRFGNFLASNDKIDPNTQDFRKPPLLLKQARSAPDLAKSRARAHEQYHGLLEKEETVIQFDTQKNLRTIHGLSIAAQDRVISIARHKRFQAWLSSTTSSTLFVNANNTTTAPIRSSPSSFICAKLASSIEDASEDAMHINPDVATNAIVVRFFCAEHGSTKDSRANATGILRSLIAQLLAKRQGSRHNLARTLNLLVQDDLQTLMTTLRDLIDQVPDDTVLFIVLDAITIFENSDLRRQDIVDLLRFLVEIANADDDYRCVVKLLITCPRMSRSFQKLVEREQILTLPPAIPSQGGFSANKWKAVVRPLG